MRTVIVAVLLVTGVLAGQHGYEAIAVLSFIAAAPFVFG